VKGRLGVQFVYLRDENILKKEIKHASRLNREIEGWKETENSEWGGKKGKN
jgi:hypothetical protein